jgi:hypothetical protein
VLFVFCSSSSRRRDGTGHCKYLLSKTIGSPIPYLILRILHTRIPLTHFCRLIVFNVMSVVSLTEFTSLSFDSGPRVRQALTIKGHPAVYSNADGLNAYRPQYFVFAVRRHGRLLTMMAKSKRELSANYNQARP